MMAAMVAPCERWRSASDLEKYLVAIGFERTEIVLFVWVVGVAEIVVDGNRLHDAGYGFGSQCCDAGRDEGRTGAEVLAQFVIERTNGFGLGRHRSLLNVWGRCRGQRLVSSATAAPAGHGRLKVVWFFGIARRRFVRSMRSAGQAGCSGLLETRAIQCLQSRSVWADQRQVQPWPRNQGSRAAISATFGAMSAAVRVFVLQTLMAKLADAEARATS
jgi:hypothetical protein